MEAVVQGRMHSVIYVVPKKKKKFCELIGKEYPYLEIEVFLSFISFVFSLCIFLENN